MKFFTEEWYHNTLIAQMCFTIRKSGRASVLSDKFFEKLYKSEMAFYAKHLKRAAKFNRTSFDKMAAEAEFEQNYKDNLEFVNTLPNEILDNIADIRVFALGTVSYEVADVLTRYCGKLNRICQSIQEKYEDSLEEIAEIIGWTPINMLNMISDEKITCVEQSNGVLEISTDSCVVKLADAAADKKLENATVIAFELGHDDDSAKLYLGLLCESADGTLFDETLHFGTIEVAELD